MACALFLAALGMGLWRAAPGIDWGAQPGFAASALLLCTGPESGAGPFLVLASALGRALPGAEFAFNLNIAAALGFALAASLIFLTAARLSGSLLLALAAWCVAALLPETAALFRAARPETGAALAAAVALWAGARFAHADAGPRGLAAFAALAAVAALHHFVIGLIVALALVLLCARMTKQALRPGWIAGAAFVVLAALLPLAFAAMRPRFGIIWGPSWIQAPMEVFNIPGPDRVADAFRPGPGLLFALKQLPVDFIAAPGARYFWMLAAGLAGLVAMRRGQRGFAPVCGLMALAAPLALVLSTIRNTDLFRFLLIAPFALLYASGAGALLAEARSAPQPRVRRLAPVFAALLACAALWGARPDAGRALERQPSMAPRFAALWHEDLRRDTAAFINPEHDEFFSAPAMQILANQRRDITYLCPGEFNSREYRAMLRERAGATLPVTTEQQYEQLTNTVTESTAAPEGAPKDSALMKRRVLYNLVMLNQTIMAEDAARRRPVAFNTIAPFLRNQRFNWMCFTAGKASFRACHLQFTACVNRYLNASPEIKARIRDKKQELLRDRKFLEKAIRDKYRTDPAQAAPVMKLLESYFAEIAASGSGKSGEEGPQPGGKAGERLARFLDIEDLIKENIILPYVALITEASMGCDATREGFSVECAARNIADIMGRKDIDLFPMPEAGAYCFIKNFHWPWRGVERIMQDALHSPLRRDPVAARIMAGHLADLAEHAWIHNNDYLGGARGGDGAKAQDEPHLQWLLENAARLSPDNARARFLLALVAMENDPHGALAQEQLEAVQRILTRREERSGLNDYETYMLVEVYSRMGLRDQSEKYLERLEGGSRLPMY